MPNVTSFLQEVVGNSHHADGVLGIETNQLRHGLMIEPPIIQWNSLKSKAHQGILQWIICYRTWIDKAPTAGAEFGWSCSKPDNQPSPIFVYCGYWIRCTAIGDDCWMSLKRASERLVIRMVFQYHHESWAKTIHKCWFVALALPH